jgi:hypothetical protein
VFAIGQSRRDLLANPADLYSIQQTATGLARAGPRPPPRGAALTERARTRIYRQQRTTPHTTDSGWRTLTGDLRARLQQSIEVTLRTESAFRAAPGWISSHSP